MDRRRLAGISLIFFLLLGGLVSCGVLSRVEMSPESREFYTTARLIMTDQEKKIFKHLPDRKSRKEFIQEFWEKRDPNPDTEENEFKKKFNRRIQYANERFHEGIPGWKTDRGRMYIYFGSPDKIDRHPMMNQPDIKGYQIWYYYRYDFAIEFVDKRGDNSYTFNPHSGVHGNFFNALENARLGLIQQEKGFSKKFMDFGLTYDSGEKEVVISIPVKDLIFTQEDRLLKADFEFEFFVYSQKHPDRKNNFQKSRQFEATEDEVLEKKNLTFTFSVDLEPGKYFFDVIIIGKHKLGKARKIFKVKI
ncbi:GWxTD domain-containing protein [bacterium]|nr:GWxTD domain-containing protein [bacterium]